MSSPNATKKVKKKRKKKKKAPSLDADEDKMEDGEHLPISAAILIE